MQDLEILNNKYHSLAGKVAKLELDLFKLENRRPTETTDNWLIKWERQCNELILMKGQLRFLRNLILEETILQTPKPRLR